MWASLCNFFCNKFFQKHEIGYHQSNTTCDGIYGKRLKLIDRILNVNGLLSRSTSCSLSMQKENVDISDDEEDCCIIAEIPRRKKPGASLAKTSTQSVQSSVNSPSSDLFVLHVEPSKKDPEVKFLRETMGSTKIQQKRFFSTQRASPGVGKVMKSRMYKNYLRKKMNFLQEVSYSVRMTHDGKACFIVGGTQSCTRCTRCELNYRLTEKYQYVQLLRSQTTCNFLNPKPVSRSIKNVDSTIEIIDLCDDKTSDSDDSSLKTEKADDQDVQIMGERAGPRSFQDILKFRPLTTIRSTEHYNGNSDKFGLPDSPISVGDDDYEDLSQKTDILEEKLRNFMQITGPVHVETECRESCHLPELTHEQERKIKNALIPEPSHEVLSEGFGLRITRRDMQTLCGLNWLNDEIINFYMNLIMERSKISKKLPKVYAFNTFFYPKLVSSGYASLRRWTKQVDIFSFDLILVPIHLGMHWCLAVIDFRRSSVKYYDSVGSPNDLCLERLLSYLKAESLDKRNKSFQSSNWLRSNEEDIPQQMNGADCGVFSCMFAEHLARDASISFTQDDMPYFRKKIVIEILQKMLLN